MTVRHSRPATVVQNPSPQAEVTGEQARNMNVVNTEDIVKYPPSLQIRKRYIGDRNAIIAARQPVRCRAPVRWYTLTARCFSNLLGNSFAYPARWNLVGSEEIDAVNVLYGPFFCPSSGQFSRCNHLDDDTKTGRRRGACPDSGFFPSPTSSTAPDMTAYGHQEQASGGFE